MRTYNGFFESSEALRKEIVKSGFDANQKLFVQLFLNVYTRESVCEIRDDILEILPNALILGTTADGVLVDTKVSEKSHVLSITAFENTVCKTYLQEMDEGMSSATLGEALAKNSLSGTTKVAILFSEGLHVNGEEFLEAYASSHPNVHLAGGMAADGARFQETWVFTQSAITNRGAVCATLESEVLEYHSLYNNNWTKIGLPLKITKAIKNRVYTINNKPAAQMYRHYLGDEVYSNLPATAIEFPLIFEHDGIDISRAAIGRLEDDSLLFSGNVTQGIDVHLGFGNAALVADSARQVQEEFQKYSIESIFVYSCMGRRRFLQGLIATELAPLSMVAQTSGFFTYGEFFKGENVELLNQTMTVLALSESHQTRSVNVESDESILAPSSVVKTQNALIHLVQVSSSEIQNLNEQLEKNISQKTQELEATVEELRRATKSKSEFLANMSHEIRTPLNAILGFLELLRKDENDPKRLKKFDIIKHSSYTLLGIINDILDISKLESGKYSIEKYSFDVGVLLDELVLLFDSKAKEKNITLTLNKVFTHCSLKSDEGRVRQIISNLLSNAIKFTPEGGRVEISADYNEATSFFEVSVKDSGCGIAKENLEKIFEPFSQEDASITRKYGGTGLGLAISNRFAQLLDGSLAVQSRVNEGSTFTLTLQNQQCETLNEKKIDEGEAEAVLHFDAKVLIVEDNRSNQLLLRLFLEEYGIECDIANDGVEGVAAFQKKKYDLIFMDENMPNLSGIQATEQIRMYEKEHNLQASIIVASTANALVGDREKFLEAGMDDFLSKPIETKELEAILKKYL